jgi:hypothetical protein
MACDWRVESAAIGGARLTVSRDHSHCVSVERFRLSERNWKGYGNSTVSLAKTGPFQTVATLFFVKSFCFSCLHRIIMREM